MLPLHVGVEDDPPPICVQAHAELDVLHGGERVTPLVEAAELQEDVTAYRTEAGPEGCRGPGPALVNMVVEKVSNVRDESPCIRIIVVGAEEGRELTVALEGPPDAD